MSGIRKISKNPRREKIEQPKIIGARGLGTSREAPKTLDQRTKSKPVEIETKEHGEVITVQSHIRSKPRKKNEPEVRLRSMTAEEKAAWESIKTNQWEDE